MVIGEAAVEKCLAKIDVKKAAGPDGICGKILKSCRKQLAPILSKLFQVSLVNHCIPSLWLTSELIPVPKLTLPKVKNDLRPVALTPIVMKCFERINLDYMMPVVKPFLDIYQFAYSHGIGVEDAVMTLNDILRSHLESKNSHARLLFVDFSSAFNTIQPHVLMKKLIDMKVNSHLILWIHQFLTNRTQYVKFNNTKSRVIIINTGAPQGCVLSAFLFTIYTTDCKSNGKGIVILKYADDTVIVGLLTNNDDSTYQEEVKKFCDWCDNNFLNLNVKKTKEMVVDFRKDKGVSQPLKIKDEIVETVDTYKYLGNVIDNQLKGSDNVAMIVKKANVKLYFLRKLKALKVSKSILTMFYKSIVQSNLSFCIANWFEMCSASDNKKITRIIKCAKRMGCDISDIQCIYKKALLCKMLKIRKNMDHPLTNKFVLLPSGKRMRSIPSKTNRYRDSFVLSAIRHYVK